MPGSDSLTTLTQHPVGKHVTHLKTLEGTVTTSRQGVWDADDLVRHLLYHFFAINRSNPRAIRVSVHQATVTIATPKTVHLEQFCELSSEKSAEEAVPARTGFTAALLSLIRDYHIEPIAVSKNQVLSIRRADSGGAQPVRQSLVFEFFQSTTEYPGTQLLLRQCCEPLARAFATGMTHFFYDGNPLLGARLWLSPKEQFALYAATTPHGHLFYQGLKRGELPHIPIVLVMHRAYAALDTLLRQGDVFQPFSDKLLGVFYKVFVQSGIQNHHEVQRLLVEAARPYWVEGHPLLQTLAKLAAGYYACGRGWAPPTTAAVFGDGYYARVTAYNPTRRREYERLESAWKQAGKVALPAYFRAFGVLNAEAHCRDLEQQAQAEARQKAHRLPSAAEQASITLLAGCLRGLAPTLMGRFDKSRTLYSVAETDTVLGQLKQERAYLARDVYLPAQLFTADFPKALALFLHEHAHLFNDDSSQSGAEALLELLESVVRHRTHLDFYETRWQETRLTVLNERVKTTHYAALLTTKSEDDLRALVLKLPPAVVTSLLEDEEP